MAYGPKPEFKELADVLAHELDSMAARATEQDQEHGVRSDWRSGDEPGLHLMWGHGVRLPTIGASPLAHRFQYALRAWRIANQVYRDSIALVEKNADHGELYELTWVGGYRQLLLVTCPSTKQKHILFLPQRHETGVATAKAARAWTFGMTAEEFDLALET